MSFLQWFLVISLLAVTAWCSRAPEQQSGANLHPSSSLSKQNSLKTTAYTVQKGDSLYEIGFRFDLDYQDIAAWNQIAEPYLIKEGQVLQLTQPSSGSVPKSAVNKKLANNEKNSFVKIVKSVLSIAKNNKLTKNWRWPMQGTVVKPFSLETNNGIDIGGQLNQAVYAVADGQVVYSGDGLVGYANLVIVKHDADYLTAYANNAKRMVNEGDTVKQGQLIARLGSVGGQTCLHFEVRKNGNPVNPIEYLPDK